MDKLTTIIKITRLLHKKIYRLLINKQFLISIAGVFVGLFIIVLMLPNPRYHTGFRTLTELQAHAATLDEWIKMENDNELLPNYDQYYKKTYKPTFWRTWKEKARWLFSKMYIIKQPYFSASFFKALLHRVTQTRTDTGYTEHTIQKIAFSPETKLVVFGPTQGAFHSLVRDLAQLQTLGIINEKLQLQHQEYVLVFLGNVINRSPYTLDTLALVLRLMEENPQQVIYLRGTNEFFDYWRDHTLKLELEFRCKKVSDEKIPLSITINRFFETLPLALYATLDAWNIANKIPYLRIAPFIDPRLQEMVNDTLYANFIAEKSENFLETFKLDERASKPQEEAHNILLLAHIKDILKRDFFEITDGLKLLPPIHGVIAWHVLSCPTEPYRTSGPFTHDAFVVISPNKNIWDWKISLFNREVLSDKKTYLQKDLFLFSSY